MTYNILVCGNELLTPTADTLAIHKVEQMNPITRNAYNDSPRTQTPVGDPVIPYATYAPFFTLDNSGSDTGSFCTVKTYSLFSDSTCTTAWTDLAKVNLNGGQTVDSTSTQITVGLSVGFPLQTVYL